MQTHTLAFSILIVKEWMHMWQMQWNVQGDIVFMEAPPFPLLWSTSRVYSSSRWHHCAGWGEKIQDKYSAWNPFIACLLHTATECLKDRDQMQLILSSFYSRFGSFSPCCCNTIYCALPDIRTCDHYVVYFLAEAEHGYASMPPFISSRERESLKRKSKSKKNTSSR